MSLHGVAAGASQQFSRKIDDDNLTGLAQRVAVLHSERVFGVFVCCLARKSTAFPALWQRGVAQPLELIIKIHSLPCVLHDIIGRV
jgi:hypothetical protein